MPGRTATTANAILGLLRSARSGRHGGSRHSCVATCDSFGPVPRARSTQKSRHSSAGAGRGDRQTFVGRQVRTNYRITAARKTRPDRMARDSAEADRSNANRFSASSSPTLADRGAVEGREIDQSPCWYGEAILAVGWRRRHENSRRHRTLPGPDPSRARSCSTSCRAMPACSSQWADRAERTISTWNTAVPRRHRTRGPEPRLPPSSRIIPRRRGDSRTAHYTCIATSNAEIHVWRADRSGATRRKLAQATRVPSSPHAPSSVSQPGPWPRTQDTVTLAQHRALVLLGSRGDMIVGGLADALNIIDPTSRVCATGSSPRASSPARRIVGLNVAAFTLRWLGPNTTPAATADEYLHTFHKNPRPHAPPSAAPARMIAGVATLGSGRRPMGLEGPSLYLGATIGDTLQETRFPALLGGDNAGSYSSPVPRPASPPSSKRPPPVRCSR